MKKLSRPKAAAAAKYEGNSAPFGFRRKAASAKFGLGLETSRQLRKIDLVRHALTKDLRELVITPWHPSNPINHTPRPLARTKSRTPFPRAASLNSRSLVSALAIHTHQPSDKRQSILDHGIFRHNILA